MSSDATSTPVEPPQHFLGLTEAKTINTRYFAALRRAVTDLAAAQAMGVGYGEAGLGKTYAADWATHNLSIPYAWFDFPTRTSMKRIAQVMLRQITGVPHKGERYDLSDTLIDVLAEKPRLIVIDEAQRLGPEGIEFLRWLHDSRTTQFALLFVGGNGCWRVLSSFPMLRRRIYRRVEFKPLTPADVLQIMPSYHPIYADAHRSDLTMINRRFVGGNFGHLARFTRTAVEVCADREQDTIDETLAEAAFARIADDGR